MTITAGNIPPHARVVRHGLVAESFLGLQTIEDDPLAVFHGFPPEQGDVAVQFIFGGRTRQKQAMAIMENVRWPLMWLPGDSCDGRHLEGTQALMIQGADVRRLAWKGRIMGSCWSDADADYCWLAGISPDDITAPRSAQTRQVFDNLAHILAQAGMSFRDVVRTWLFLDAMLDWYGEFNAARTAFFREGGVFEHLVPASTGIGASNFSGAALMAGAVAIRPKHAGVTIAAVDSPLQCPAGDYHSSFSRAVEIRFPGRRHLMVSGTAGIAPDGSSMHIGDVSAQIDRTMRTVQAILESRGMNWDSTVRAIAYFNRMGDAPLLAEYCRAHGITNLPLINVHATVCRPGLLFEMEADAVKGT